MNEKELNEQRTQDKGLKAAMARRRSQRPQMPKGLNERVMQKAAATSSRGRRWWAAAASIVAVSVLAFIGYEYEERKAVSSERLATISSSRVKEVTMVEPSHTVQEVQRAQEVQVVQEVQEVQEVQVVQEVQEVQKVKDVKKVQEVKSEEEPMIEIQLPRDEVEPKVVYASTTINKDTVVKAPARMEEFVEKMAEFCKAESADLDCLKSKNDSIVSRMYVIEDSPEKEVFERLIQMAVWYDNDAPGYFLTFSGQQFLFQLHDLEQNLKYFVMAERINAGRILLYSTHIPLGSQFSMACYLDYRNKLNGGGIKVKG